MSVRTALRIERIGGPCRQAIGSAGDVAIVGTFERSIHFAVGDRIVCVVDGGLGNGPLNAVLAPWPADRMSGSWTRLCDRHGTVGRVVAGSLAIADVVIEFTGAKPWVPPPWPLPAPPSLLREGLRRLESLAAAHAPADGLARPILIPGDPASTATPLARVAPSRLTGLEGWLHATLLDATLAGQPGSGSPPPTGLLGLGPGLTPSGDDVLCGALIALIALRHRQCADTLAASLLRDARTATTRLSRSFLAAAAVGEGSEALHLAVAALLSGRLESLPALALDVGRIGHTSGWDALAGAALVVRAHAGLEQS